MSGLSFRFLPRNVTNLETNCLTILRRPPEGISGHPWVGTAMITVIAAPGVSDSTPRFLMPTPQPPQGEGADPTECSAQPDPIIEHLRLHRSREVGRWAIISAIEPDQGGPRAALRKRRSAMLKRLDELVRAGAIERVGRYHLRLPGSTVRAKVGDDEVPCPPTVRLV